MSAQCEVVAKAQTRQPMGLFERYLTVWVLLCIGIGISLGALFPSLFQGIAKLEVAQVNLPVAVLIWLMIIPMLLKIDFKALKQVSQHWKGIGVTLFINWLIKPFLMAFLGWLFIRVLFADWLPADQLDSYIAGLILLGAAPCTAMVFVWSNLADGEPNFTLSQVALNDTVMVFAFAPIVGLLLGISAIVVPWDTLLISVVIYIVIPVIISQWLRQRLVSSGQLTAVLQKIQPWSLLALLTTLILLFGFQGKQVLDQPIIIGLLAVPIIIQAYLTFFVGYGLNYKLKEPYGIAAPSALIGASNFFELAVATAIALFGFNSGAALATVVGVLVEVPVMLSLVAILNRTQPWYDKKLATK